MITKHMDKELWLFTMRYPYGTGETFIGTELPFLCEAFDRVVLIPLIAEGEPRDMPPNAEIRKVLRDPYARPSVWTLARNLKTFRHLVATVRASCPSPALLAERWPAVRSMCLQAIQRAATLKAVLLRTYDPSRVVLYSFWTADWATVLGVLRHQDPRVRFFTRMQGFDLYAERSKGSWPAFRAFQLNQVERIYVTSKTGLAYLHDRYAAHRAVFQYSPLGTDDHGIAPWSPCDTLRIISCANLIPLKRVHLLAEALRLVNIPVEWTHFGDGEERPRIEAIIAKLPSNIQVRMMGRRPHTEVLKWYEQNAVDLFVHTSNTEGLPLSMKEAASFGVPMLAADAGGVKEIVHAHTGQLLPHEVTPEMLAAHLLGHRQTPMYTMAFRQGARNWWLAHFEARHAYGRFCQDFLAQHAQGVGRPEPLR